MAPSVNKLTESAYC